MVKLAMFKGRGKIGNWLIRRWTRSEYSHCALLVDGFMMSSTITHNGVTVEPWLGHDPAEWDVIELPWALGSSVLDYANATAGMPYDWLGLLGSQILNFRINSPRASFCSEWCAAALGLPNPETYSPRTLFDLCRWLVK